VLDTNDRPTLGERYGSATESSNLRVENDRRGPADLLIAAGWLEDHLGALLFRLGHEFDGQKGEHGIAKAEFERMELLACRLERGPLPPPPDAVDLVPVDMVQYAIDARAKLKAQAAALREEAKRQAITSRALILINLKTLREAKEALAAFAWRQGRRWHLEWPDHVMAAVVGQALDIHLDATCHHCQGRGFNGGFGGPRIQCKPCGETGARSKQHIGRDDQTRDFGGYLLDEMKRMLALAAASMKRATMGEDESTEEGRAAAQAAMLERLRAARSVEAAKD